MPSGLKGLLETAGLEVMAKKCQGLFTCGELEGEKRLVNYTLGASLIAAGSSRAASAQLLCTADVLSARLSSCFLSTSREIAAGRTYLVVRV